MPPPYPEEWTRDKPGFSLGRPVSRGARHCRRNYLNLLVMYLGFLSLGEPTTAPPEVHLGRELTHAQRMTVDQLGASTAWWSPNASVAAGELGRGAGRARTTLDAIAKLTTAAATYKGGSGGAYAQPSCDSTRYENRRGSDNGTHRVGTMKTFSAGPVVPVVASRVKFFGKPTFDPRPLLSNRSKALYENPQNFRISPSGDFPVARVLASQSEFLLLLDKLDKGDRLVLRPASDSERRLRVGLQCTYKDEDLDRLILDARPPNAHEVHLKRFVRHMANASMLLEIVLADDEVLASYLDDIRDMYYVFQVSEARAHRNTFSREVRGSEVRHLMAFPAGAGDADKLVASLKTMAMGDTNACEIAQESHLAIAYESGLLRPSTFLSPAALAPRGPVAIGIIIDDYAPSAISRWSARCSSP